VQDLAAHCIFEEVAFLLVYGHLPTAAELKTYCAKLSKLRELPPQLRTVLEQVPKDAHPMDVMRTGNSSNCINNNNHFILTSNYLHF
jgi:2-methylcitrate synthase